MSIINSLLDTDMYKLTMMQSALHQFNNTQVEYRFKCRNKAVWNNELLGEINKEIDNYCTLRFQNDELDYLSEIPFFKEDFIDFLRLFQANRNHISVWLNEENELQLRVVGSWYLTILFEVPVLAIINEIYFSHFTVDQNKGIELLDSKLKFAKEKGFPFADFGTRRRFSRNWHDQVIQKLKVLPNFTGTSNVYLAMKYNLKPMGTMAHEYIMAGAGQDDVPLVKSQAGQLQKWVDEYRGDLGIALTDTYGFDAFLRDFDSYFAKLYDGLRHDSGDPLAWAEKAHEIYLVLKDQARISFGIGTHLTNDFPGIEALQIVMKLVSCNNRPVAKISDSPGKAMCDDNSYIEYVKKVFNL